MTNSFIDAVRKEARKTATEERIEEKRATQLTYLNEAESIRQQLLPMLKTYQKNVINKTFFEALLEKGNEYRQFYISNGNYSFESDKLFINGRYFHIQIASRNKQDIIPILEERLVTLDRWMEEGRKEIAQLETIDDAKIIADLREVFERNGRPETWGRILEMYEVRYPTKK